MLYIKSKAKILAIVLSSMFFPVYAGVATDVGNGVSDVANGVGSGVEAVGNGVGNAVKDVGNGVGNAISGTPMQSSSNSSSAATDTAINANANAKLKSLMDNNQIASGSNLQVSSTNGVVTVTGTVAEAIDINTVKNSMSSLPGVKSVNMDGVTVSTP